MSLDEIKEAFGALVERGIIDANDLEESTVTDEMLEEFEQEMEIKIPEWFKTYLKAYAQNIKGYQFPEIGDLTSFPVDVIKMVFDGNKDALNRYYGDEEVASMFYYNPMIVPHQNPLGPLKDAIEELRDYAEYDENIDVEQLKKFLPIADCAGFVCIDTSIDENNVDYEDPSTWSIRWFDHEEFDFEEAGYMDDAGNITGNIMFPTFKAFMEIHFKGIFSDLTEE